MSVYFQELIINSPAYQCALQLRNEVLRKPLGLSLFDENLSTEHDNYGVLAFDDAQLVGCIMLQPVTESCVKFRQMAVSPLKQKSGIGTLIVQEAERLAIKHGFSEVVLHARESAIGFYTRLGYSIQGARFMEVSIPHFKMKKSLY